ncbi:MAG TPA: condensation domain-containing protein, partial [Longimicrobium sp.]
LPGELYVGGDGVARGYLGRPALTAERFVPDPFSREAGARMYRTGDRVRVRECESAKVRVSHGDDVPREDASTFALSHSRTFALEFLGRLDGQVKVRGFRIETGEIEAAVRSFPGVRDCVVVAAGEGGERRLVAYVVGGVDADEVRAHLRRTLPDYMVPGAFVALDRLPLTPNGKLDRRALPAPERAAREHVAPRTPAEEVLAGIWAEVLRVERVGATDDFFALGGHSLLATRVISRIRTAFGVEPTVRALFEAPTLAELARAVEGMRRGDDDALPPVLPVARTGALPLSFAQERLWLEDRLRPESAVYNVPAGVRLRGALDADALQRALGEVVRRHEALRTVFADRDGVPVQQVAPFAGFTLPVEDLSGLGGAEREAAVRRRGEEEAERPFDLAAGPLFRAALLRVDEEEHVLLLCMHHIVSDGWSVGVLFRELSALYGARVRGESAALPELAVQYADYAAWQRTHLQGAVLDRQLAWWTEQLSGASPRLELPTDRPRPAVQSHRGAGEAAVFGPELRDRLKALGRGEGATLYMVLLAAFQVLLSKYSGSTDVVVGSPVAGRTRAEVEGLIGFFVNTLALRADLSGEPSFREVLGRVRETTLGAYAHQDLPFERLVEEINPGRTLNHTPLFQVMFALQNHAEGRPRLHALQAEPLGGVARTARYDLTLYMAEGETGLRAWLEYSTDLFDAATVLRMLEHLGVLLEGIARDPGRPVAELPLLTDEGRGAMLALGAGTAAAYPRAASVHALFREQAKRTPDAEAVAFGGETLTYAELEARANRLANHLRGLGVGPEARVGICLERGVEMVVGMLGILKAGGAYVPLDPSYPAERLAFMLRDADVPVLVTELRLKDAVPEYGGQVVRVDADAPRIA